MSSEAGHETPKAGQPARSDRTDVTGLVPVTALSRWALNFHRAVTGLNPVTSIGFGAADPSADAWRSQD